MKKILEYFQESNRLHKIPKNHKRCKKKSKIFQNIKINKGSIKK